MSENSPYPELPDDNDELESLLRKLDPSAMDVGQMKNLRREYSIVSSELAHDPTQVQWRKVIPLTIACLVVMFIYGTYRYGPKNEAGQEVAITTETVVERNSSPPSPASSGIRGFQPVSSQGFLINASSQGIVETEQGPRERMNLEYRDAYHWHDPETGTNLRFFLPRSEEVIIPLQTD